jgi:hypothetical protein
MLLSLAACGDGTPLAAYQHPLDAAAAVLPLDVVGIHSCADARIVDGAKVIEGRPLDQCYKMEPQRRFRGIWLDQFEGSRFYEGLTNVQQVRAAIEARLKQRERSSEWLSFAKEDASTEPSPTARLVSVEFLGRRTAYPGRYGHMGISGSEVLVDRMIAARSLYVSKFDYIECEFEKSSVSCE